MRSTLARALIKHAKNGEQFVTDLAHSKKERIKVNRKKEWINWKQVTADY